MKKPHELSNWDHFKLGVSPVAYGLTVAIFALWSVYSVFCGMACVINFISPRNMPPAEELPMYYFALVNVVGLSLAGLLALTLEQGRLRAKGSDA